MIEIHTTFCDKQKITMEMKEKAELLCSASATFKEDTAELTEITEFAPDFAYEMGKAILNAIDLKGIKLVVSENFVLENILIKLGFLKIDNVFKLDLTDYFISGCKNCKDIVK